MFSSIVADLTGDWLFSAKCDDLQADNRRSFDEVVYFGDKADVQRDGVAFDFTRLAIADRYNFQESRAQFLFVDDPECGAEFGLEAGKKHILFLNGPET